MNEKQPQSQRNFLRPKRMRRRGIHFLGLVETHVLLDGVQHLERLARVLRAMHPRVQYRNVGLLVEYGYGSRGEFRLERRGVAG